MMYLFGEMSKDKKCKGEGKTAGREEIRAGYYEKGDSEEKVLSEINTFKGREKVGAVGIKKEN